MTKSGTVCVVCGVPAAQPERGRRRRYCSRSCQARAYRARRDAAPPPRRAKPARLTDVGIVCAAIVLADRDGLSGLSMRRLATELGVATTGLYRYFPDRDTLLAEMAEYALADAPPPPGTGDWRERLTAEARGEWQLYRRHPWMLPVLAQTRPPVGPALLDSLERSFAALDHLGMSRETMFSIYLSISGLVQGLALLPGSEGARLGTGSPAAAAEQERTLAQVSDATHPTLARYFTPDAAGIEGDYDRFLDDGLELLIDGIIARHLPDNAKGSARKESAPRRPSPRPGRTHPAP
ncbi:TetR/AcrR family transcriptional regulator [Nocardia crassostreae]|uniref:TetR/AcrR family transcriptional regulator n=1 Tax=Nocardia crassostreae TaxID=53428 RepID=UPI0009FDA4A3|nr:TetR/AcrR family transcriptional regulator [Nocardia crassostreae]